MIFVSIASYYDGMLQHTLLDAISRAKYKDNLTFGIVDQIPFEHRLYPKAKNIRYVGIDPGEARGACWARALCMSLYEGEEFFLQIDSHTLFDEGWDEDLIKKLESCPSPKPIISSYPNAFEIVDKQPVRKPTTDGALCNVVTEDFKEDYTLSFVAHGVEQKLVPGFALGAGCIFTHGYFVNEVPYDPMLYFIGEEQSMALRAFTHGWDIFHVPLPLYHLYDTDPGNCYRPKHWDEKHDTQRRVRWWEMDKLAKERLKKLLTGQNIGVYGLGTARTMQDYAEYSGIDYMKRVVNDIAKRPRV